MNLSQTQKIILGIFTFLPFLLFPFLLWQMVDVIFEVIKTSEYGEPDHDDIVMAVFSLIVPIVLLALCCLALLIFYIVHAVVNKNLETAEQLLWILLFVFFGIIAFPIYWFMRIWNN